ncbi:MAG TPA: penicillin-binding protein 2 [Myxococcota bacterium]|nr:penicillin-binding protein 2 [Myxococcota bacterium]
MAHLAAPTGASLEGRIRFVALLVLLAFGGFVVRLFHLQVVEGAMLRERSQKNSVRKLDLDAPRGEVLDREGRVIATWRSSRALRVVPNDLVNRERTFAALGQLLGARGAELDERSGPSRGLARFRPVTLVEDLDWERLARVESHGYALPGVETFEHPRRFYPGGPLAAHLLGTLGEIQAGQLALPEFATYRQGEVIGQSGLEARYEAHLRGEVGERQVVVDAAGREIEVLREVPPGLGGRIVLALDKDLQEQAEAGFRDVPEGEPQRMGAAVALDVRSGDVLALASFPTYDPNVFTSRIDRDTWRALTGDEWRPLRDRAIQNHYPPGSTHKAVMAAAALQEGVVDLDTRVYCPGHYYFGGRRFGCWKKEGHGSVNVIQALQRSCDVFFYTVGVQLGIDRIAKHASSFGLGDVTGIDLPGEARGVVPSTEWKQRTLHEKWYPGETVSAAIGQSYNLYTPLQLAVAYAAIANGGRVMKPRVVLRLEGRAGEVLEEFPPQLRETATVSDANLAIVREGLTAVVEVPGGTGARARVPGVRVAGKTGTVQVVSLDRVRGMKELEIPIRLRDHAWFVAFAPADAPEIAVAVFVEHGLHGSSAAAPIAQRILAKYFQKSGRSPIPAATPEPPRAKPAPPAPIAVPTQQALAPAAPPQGPRP